MIKLFKIGGFSFGTAVAFKSAVRDTEGEIARLKGMMIMKPSTVCAVTFAVSLLNVGAVPVFAQAGKTTVTDRLNQNTALSTKLQDLLSPATDIHDAAEGFDQLAEFVSAVYVSYNLGIPFDELKAKIMSSKELGPAIHELRPGVNPRQAIIKANSQARDLLEKSTSNVNFSDAERMRPEY